ncbi:MAG: hypothetical protein K5829_14660 [Treponema sp.]|nr:hypothetical protein [Treponema sp.]
MKRFISIFAISLIALSTFMFSGCELFKEVIDELAPTDTWCSMSFKVSEVELNFEVIYVEEEFEGKSTSGSKNLKKGVTLEPGITMLITVADNADTSGLAETMFSCLESGMYIMKTFSSSSSSSTDANGDVLKFAGSQVTWGALYLLKSDLQEEDNQRELPEAPYQLTPNASAQEVSDFKNFSWKEFIKSILGGSKLLGE